MSEEPEKKKSGRQIGSIRDQYATLGGGRKPVVRPDVQPSSVPDAQPSSHLAIQHASNSAIQPSNRLAVQPSSMPDAQPASHLDSEASSMPDAQPSRKPKEEKLARIKMTLYLEEDNDDWVRDFCRRERRRLGHHVEISDVVNMALRSLRSQVES